MSIERMTINGYGQVELNNAAFRRDGRVEAQCVLGAAFTEDAPAENGMILAVDKAAGKIGLPASETGDLIVGLNYSAEHQYSTRKSGLKNFCLVEGQYPRIGYLAKGDLFTTNCVCYDTETYNDEADLEAALKNLEATPMYGHVHTSGAILVNAVATDALLRVVKKTTMPDGQVAVQFQAIK